MDELKRQVERARWRMNLDAFLWTLSWSLLATLAVATAAVVIPKIWVINVDPQWWTASWLIGAAGVGLLVAVIMNVMRRRSSMEAAVEIDRRFGLKERVASTISLGSKDLETEAGRALVGDAMRRVQRVDVRERFRFNYLWRPAYPMALAAVAAAFGLLMPNASQKAEAKTDSKEIKKLLQEAITKKMEIIARKAEENQKKLEEKLGAKAEDLKEATKELNKLSTEKVEDRKEALVKINDLQKELAKKRDMMTSSNEMKKNLEEQLKDFAKGPADKMADALKKGDFMQAAKEFQKLQEKLEKGELNQDEKAQLAKQLEQLKEKVNQIKGEREKKKQELKEAAEKQRQAGNLAEAAKLQKQLEQMEAQDGKMAEAADKMSENLQKAAEALAKGDSKEASKQMSKMAAQMGEMQEQQDQLEAMDEMLDQLSDAKDAMACDKCNGAGCKECNGNGNGKKGNKTARGGDKGKRGGRDGKSKGPGSGERPEEETDVDTIESQVRAKPQKGVSVRVGDAGGPNMKGQVTQEAHNAVVSSLKAPPDAINDVALPRDQRENASEYFDKLRKGE